MIGHPADQINDSKLCIVGQENTSAALTYLSRRTSFYEKVGDKKTAAALADIQDTFLAAMASDRRLANAMNQSDYGTTKDIVMPKKPTPVGN